MHAVPIIFFSINNPVVVLHYTLSYCVRVPFSRSMDSGFILALCTESWIFVNPEICN